MAVHLVVCSLRLYCRDYIVYLVDDSLVEVEYSLCSSLEGPAVAVKVAALDELRNIVQLWVKAYYCRVFKLDYSLDKSVK